MSQIDEPSEILDLSDVKHLTAGLDDPRASVHTNALRVLVRLPLMREAWLEVSRRMVNLLQSPRLGDQFENQSVEGFPLREVIDAAVFVPTLAVRNALRAIARTADEDERRAAAYALARARDTAAVPQLKEDFARSDERVIKQVANYLGVREPTLANVRFWLAIELAHLAETSAIEQVFDQLNRGVLELGMYCFDNATTEQEQLRAKGPFPQKADLLFRQIASDSSYPPDLREKARYLVSASEERRDEPIPPASTPDALMTERAKALATHYMEQPPFPVGADIPEQDLETLKYLDSAAATALVTRLFQHAASTPYSFSNSTVRLVASLHQPFAPDIPALFEIYRQVVALSDLARFERIRTGVEGRPALSLQVAWAASRAGLQGVVSALSPRTNAGHETESEPAAWLIEDAIKYAREVHPPLFGGGSAPPDVAPPMDFSFDVADFPRSEERPVRAMPLPPPEKARARRPAKRVVNTGFAPQEQPDQLLDPRMPLKAGERYYFCLDIGKPLLRSQSIETTPSDIPVSSEAITVTLVGFTGELKITPGADMGRLKVQAKGPAVVLTQPSGKPPSQSRHLDRRLFFPVRAPEKSGTYRLRCNIYCRQILLQSRLVHARVMDKPRLLPRGARALRSDLDYVISHSLDPMRMTRSPQHKLSIQLNSNADGTHSFHFLGMDGKTLFKNDDVRFREGELKGMITEARGTLRIATWGKASDWRVEDGYRYDDGRRDLPRLKGDLENLARWGYNFFTEISRRLVSGEDQSGGLKDKLDQFERILAQPGLIQIALKESPAHVLPAALVYDYPLDTGAETYRLCPDFERAFNQGIDDNALMQQSCFQGKCPTRNEKDVICPSGFWGFRHYLGMPLTVGRLGLDATPEIGIENELRLAMCVATDLALLDSHKKLMQTLRHDTQMCFADNRAEVFRILTSFKPHVVYFYCHGGLRRNLPILQVGGKDSPGIIDQSNFRSYRIIWDNPRPLVFINGCHTAAVEPEQALDLIGPLVEYSQSAGVIGTEITIFPRLATAFAEECLRRFASGATIGEAIRGARLALLMKGNPLGLAYIPFAMAGLKLGDHLAGPI